MKKQNYFVFISFACFWLLALASCNVFSEVEQCDDQIKLQDSTIKIDLVKNIVTEKLMLTSQLIENTSLIKLETDSTNIVGKVLRVEISDSSIYLLDDNGVLFSFNLDGSINYKLELNKIDNKRFSDWRFDHSKKTHYLWDTFGNEMYLYDSRGVLKERVKIRDLASTDFAILDSSHLLFYNDFNGLNKIKSALYYYSIDDKEVYKAFLRRPNVLSGSYYSLKSSPFAFSDKEAYYFDMYNYDVYGIPQKTACPQKLYHLDFGQYNYPDKFMDPKYDHDRRSLLKKGRFVKPTAFFANESLLYFEFSFDKIIKRVFINRHTGKITPMVALKSDISSLGEVYINTICFSKDKLALIVYPGYVYDLIDHLKSTKQEIPKELLDFQSNNNIYDNPILIIGDFKFTVR